MSPSIPANDDFDDELLSAYVDDELSATERARVEARLKTDPRAAALVEELRSLSSAVQSLPRKKLPRDLRATVLTKVSRNGNTAPTVIPMPTSSERWALRRRGMVWSAIAIAAALIMSISQPSADDEGDVARRAPDVSDGEKSGNEPKRELFESPADADRPVRFHQQAPSMSASPEPTAPAPPSSDPASSSDVLADSEARTDGSGRGVGGGVGGEVDGAKLDSFAADESGDNSAAVRTRELAAPAMAPVGKELQKSVAPPRIVEITMARGDAVSRFKQLLSDKKIAIGVDKTSPAATLEKMSAKLKAAATEEILVDASPAQIEQLIFSCQADKAFARVMPRDERRAEEFYAGVSTARGNGVASAPSSMAEAKAPAGATMSAESNQDLAATVLGANKEIASESPESPPYAYGAPAAAASPGSTTPSAEPDSGRKAAADASSAMRVQVLFRFLPVPPPATKAAN